MSKTILVTGGAGYIGSHTVVQLLNNGATVIIFDNLCNSKRMVIDRIEAITNKSPIFIEGDIRDQKALRQLFKSYAINSVIHFAGLKAVKESEADPLKYYDNNVRGSITLFTEMEASGVYDLVFSSSATVYGNTAGVKYKENSPLIPMSVYGHTKLVIENTLRHLKKANSKWRVALLRYFNPVGAHASGMIGEDPNGIPNNLMPFISQVAIGKREKLLVFGNDYPTRDGTGMRDYVHVEDLAAGHLAALDVLQRETDIITVNLGTGHSYSVLEVIAAFEKISGKPIPYEITARRPGDFAEYYADSSLAKKILHWEPKYNLDDMCQDTWRWQQNNPEGYEITTYESI